jgi:pimeloyl-ACP methyl ester carboxylesterase
MPYANNNGVKLHYEVFGEGPPLFLHVGLGGEWDLWKLAGFLDRLEEFQLIINDPRGFGSSDRPKTLAAYRMKNFVQDVVTILDDLQISKCFFWGHSDGAKVGNAFADAYPSRLRALIAAGGAMGPTDGKERRDFAKFVRENGMGFLSEVFEKSYGKKLPLWYTRGRPLRDPAIVGLQLLAWIPWANEAWEMYPRIKVPTLLITGDKEDPTGLNKKIARAMPDARCVVLKELRPESSDVMLDHVDELMRSDITVPRAKRFLRKHMR